MSRSWQFCTLQSIQDLVAGSKDLRTAQERGSPAIPMTIPVTFPGEQTEHSKPIRLPGAAV